MLKRNRKYNKYGPLLIKIFVFLHNIPPKRIDRQCSEMQIDRVQKWEIWDVVSKTNTDARANCHSVARQSSLKILISSHKISIYGLKILISSLIISISSHKISISDLKISISSHKISISTRNIFLPYVMIDSAVQCRSR